MLDTIKLDGDIGDFLDAALESDGGYRALDGLIGGQEVVCDRLNEAKEVEQSRDGLLSFLKECEDAVRT